MLNGRITLSNREWNAKCLGRSCAFTGSSALGNYWYSLNAKHFRGVRTKSYKIETVPFYLQSRNTDLARTRLQRDVGRVAGIGRVKEGIRERISVTRADTSKTAIEQNDSKRMQILDIREHIIENDLQSNDGDAAVVEDNDVKKALRIARLLVEK